MFLEIGDLLTPAEIGELRAIAKGAAFVDGKISNPHNRTKDNQQIDQADEAHAKSSALLLAAYLRNPRFRDFAFPRRIAPPMLCRYAPGQRYGAHSDTSYAVVNGERMRFDVSSTVFLSDPAEYQGGELTVYLGDAPFRIKGRPGTAIVYPSSTIHEVAPVTAGERLVAITFIESEIRDGAKRELLHTLNEVHAREGERMDWQSRVLLQQVQHSLHRRWAE